MIEQLLSSPVVEGLVVPFVERLFFVFGIVGFAVGVGLIANQARMHRVFGVMNRWVSLRRGTKWLAIPRDSGPAFWHFRRLVGAVFILAAAYSTFVLITAVDATGIIAALRVDDPYSLLAWLMESARRCLIVGNALAIVVGAMLIFFPAALHAIEARADHWVSTRLFGRGGETMHMEIDGWVEGHSRVMGWVIAATALGMVVAFGMLLFARG